jgi:hypothetical protein
MLVVQSLDFAHTVIAKVNTNRHSSDAWVATLVLAGAFLPSVLGLAGIDSMSKTEAYLLFSVALVLALVYTYLRRASLAQLRQAIALPIPLRARLVASLFLFLAVVLSALAAHASAWAGPVVFLLISALPWPRWASSAGAL